MSSACSFCGAYVLLDPVEATDADEGSQSFVLLSCPCCGCGSLRDPPAEAELAGYYHADYFGFGPRKFLLPLQWLFDAGKRNLARSVVRALKGRVQPRILDVGCGTGRLLLELQRLGATAIGTEREGAAGRAVRSGLQIIEADIEDVGARVGSVDAVVIWHVLEHLRDPVSALRAALGLLPSGGMLFLAVPNAASWQARLFGPHWFHLDLPRHLHFFSSAGLLRLLEAEGANIVRSGTTQVSQSLFGFIQSTLNAVCSGRPNRFYRLLREPLHRRTILELAAWSMLALLLLPFAILEAVGAGGLGRGAICRVEARKR